MYIIHLLYPHKDIPLLAERGLAGWQLGDGGIGHGSFEASVFQVVLVAGEFAGKVWRLTHPKQSKTNRDLNGLNTI